MLSERSWRITNGKAEVYQSVNVSDLKSEIISFGYNGLTYQELESVLDYLVDMSYDMNQVHELEHVCEVVLGEPGQVI